MDQNMLEIGMMNNIKQKNKINKRDKPKNKIDSNIPLFDLYSSNINKQMLNKENLTLLERSLLQGNEYKKIEKKKKIVPAKVDTEIKIDTDYSSPCDEKYEKYLHYAEKYRIPFSKGGIKKSYKELAQEIHKYEMKNLKHLLKLGLDKKYKEYGLYITIM